LCKYVQNNVQETVHTKNRELSEDTLDDSSMQLGKPTAYKKHKEKYVK
jgi:hypothetical protein